MINFKGILKGRRGLKVKLSELGIMNQFFDPNFGIYFMLTPII